ncbi:hypothetical protein DICPUDRAFT_75029 [Dictyostelium purpureum]|uniref:Potassium transport protein n=1 Tax=Dictyostelium purpureum TaxID=5786 RepID=F0Z9F5_DICPU|nr:uncharacterized protein DICPUDRAFT_75029 [Dictyostelium purpureum]EGC39374.1 hypothetical protein DICPUDRAFT_75029 [Dictyostelium purpureum]|eukprot:XP_003284048.1 hypothetical protein DICPUDRAFT_75029 [Dictyostelium purpureum]
MIKFKNISKYFKIKFRKALVWFVGYLDQNYFFRFHLLYFVTLSLVGALIIFLIEIKSKVSFIDCLYISASAITTTGLVSVDISQWSNAALFVVMVWVQLGSTVLLTLPIVLLRRYFIRNSYNNPKSLGDSSNTSSLKESHSTPNLLSSFIDPFHTMTESLHLDQPLEFSDDDDEENEDNSDHSKGDEENQYEDDHSDNPKYQHDDEIGAHHEDDIEIGGVLTMDTPIGIDDHSDEESHHDYKTPIMKSKTSPNTLTTVNTSSSSSSSIKTNNTNNNNNTNNDNNNNNNNNNNSNNNNGNTNSIVINKSSPKVVSTTHVHSYVDNMEYRSLGKLLVIIPLYIVVIYFIAFFSLAIYIQANSNSQEIMKKNNVNGWWWTLFHVISAFNNAGLGLFPDSLIQVNHKYFILLVLSTLIIVGNTLFPFFLRGILRIISKFTKDPDPYNNLLDNPRSIFTHLFPYKETIKLFLVWIIFNVSQISLMALFDTNDIAFTNMNAGETLLNYYFSSISTRTCGFNSIDISLLSESVLLLFLGLMFVSSYPFIISLRSSAVNNKYSNQRDVMKDILIRDIFIPYVCILSIAIFENQLLESGRASVFQLIFEIVSAFGNVGLTMSPGGHAISTLLRPISKLIVVITMLAGRHRNLPESIDQSINPATLKKNSIISKIITRYKRRKL